MWSLMFTPSGPQDIPTAHTQPLCCSRVQKAFARCWIYLQREAQDRWWPELFYNVLIPCHFHYSAELTLVHIFYICRVLQYFSQSFQQQGCLVVSICDIFSLLEHLIQSCRLHLQSVRTFSFINSQTNSYNLHSETAFRYSLCPVSRMPPYSPNAQTVCREAEAKGPWVWQGAAA